MIQSIEPFRIAIPEAGLADLRARLLRMRWPGEIGDNGQWQAGANLAWMRGLVSYWLQGFDWRAQERAINAWPQFRTVIDGFQIHFLHVRGKARDGGPRPMPLLLNHGWPWTFWDFQKVLGPLTDPAAHGGDAADAFDVIVPSLPGFAFSSPLARPDVTPAVVADLWVKLMERLGYGRFAVQGADLGAYVALLLGHRHPRRAIGVHLQHLVPVRKPLAAPEDYGPEEQDALARRDRFFADGSAYSAIQRTRPQTIAYAMTDSPVGLAAWLIEKRRDWAGTGGDVESVFGKDDLLTTVCLYWFTGTYLSAAHHYRAPTLPDRVRALVHDRLPVVEVPVAALQFGEDIVYHPRKWAEKVLNIQRWNVEPRGGHFGAWERPDVLVADLREFFRPLRQSGQGSAAGHLLEPRHALGHRVKGLAVAHEDRRARRAELRRIVHRPHLEHDGGKAGDAGDDLGAAIGAENARHRPFDVVAGEAGRLAAGELELVGGHHHEEVGSAAGHVLAFAAMALRLQARFAARAVMHLAAIAPSLDCHVLILFAGLD